MKKNKITVTVITLNEENTLANCLNSVRSFADEVVVVDSGSTDKTVEIARNHGAKIYLRKFDNYSNQKNFAVSKAKGDWIFALDADEVVSNELADEIKAAVKQGKINGYLIPRRNYIFGAEIKHTRWSPDKHIWLWRRNKGIWQGSIHEEVIVDGWVGELKNAKIHYQYEKVSEFWQMMNNYTEKIADEYSLEGKKFSYFMLFSAPLLSFFRRFFYKAGFKDGWRGFVLSYLMAIYRMTTWIKVWERDKTKPGAELIPVNLFLILILLLAFVLRIVALDQSLWLDEAIGAIAVKNFTYKGLLTNFLTSDNHPPLYYMLLKFWTSYFGYSEISLRMPSVIFGVGTVWLTFLIAKKIPTEFNKHFSLLAALLMATSPFHIYYSQEARMYSMAAFFAILSVYFLLVAIERSILLYWLIYSISVVAMIYTDYMPVFLIPVYWIIVFSKKDVKTWIYFIISQISVFLFGLMWLPTFMVQSEKGRWLLSVLPEWREIAGGATFKQAALVWMKFILGRITFQNKTFYYLLTTLASVPFVLALSKFNSVKKFRVSWYLWLWLFLPLIFGFLASYWVPFFIYFRFLYVIPAFYLIVASGLWLINDHNLKKFVLTMILTVNLTGLGIYYLDNNQQREEWRQATGYIENMVKEKEVILFNYPEAFAPYRWYTGGKVYSYSVADSLLVNSEKTKQRTERVLSRVDGLYYFNYLEDLTDPKGVVVQTLKDSGFGEKQIYNFRGIGQVRYWVRK